MISNLENYEFSIVSFNVHSILLDLNKFIHSSEFWKIENKELLKQIIVFTMESIRILMIFLHPFIPDYIDKFCKTCGWENISIDDTKYLMRTNKVFEVDYSLINSIFINKN